MEEINNRNLNCEEFMDTSAIDLDAENYKTKTINLFEDDYSALFKKFKEGQSNELVVKKVYLGKLESMVKTTTFVNKTPMLNLGIRISNDVKTPQLAVDSYVFDITNESYLFRTFKRLQDTVRLLGDRLDELSDIDSFIEKYQHLIGKEIYIEPYMYNGNIKFNVVDPKTLK